MGKWFATAGANSTFLVGIPQSCASILARHCGSREHSAISFGHREQASRGLVPYVLHGV